MLFDLARSYPLTSNIYIIYTVCSVKLIFESELRFEKSIIFDYLNLYKDSICKYLEKSCVYETVSFLQEDVFYSHPSYKDLFTGLFEYISHFNQTRISLFHVKKENFICEKHSSPYEITTGLFLKMKIFEKNTLWNSINGSNSQLKLHKNILTINNVLLYNNPTRAFDLSYVRFLMNKESIYDPNETIVNFIESILIKQNIDMVLIIGTTMQSEIRQILEDYGILVFDYLTSNHLKVHYLLSLVNNRVLLF